MANKKIRTYDLKVGMYVESIVGSWFSTPLISQDFYIDDPSQIKELLDYNIGYVFIDPAKAKAIVKPENNQIYAETFTVDLSEFIIGRDIPVDIYWIDETKTQKILMRKDQTFTEEVDEVCTGSGIKKVNVPVLQKGIFEKYKSALAREREGQKEQGFNEEFLNPENVKLHYDFEKNYMLINVYALIGETKPYFDIYTKTTKTPKINFRKGNILPGSKLKECKDSDTGLFILKTEREAYRNYLMEISKSSGDESVRIAYIREDAKIISEELAENPRSEALIHDSKQSISEITNVVINHPESFYGLTKLNSYDYYTFTHSVNVATLCIALAVALGLKEEDGLADLGLGAMLHDVGKVRVDSNIINKPGKLSDSEFEIIANHVILGYAMLSENKAIPLRAFEPLLQHHEKLSGKGYPNKLIGSEITALGRISSIVDIYDALTSKRSYKKAFTPFDALALLSKNEKDYDMDIFGKFVQLIHKQEA